MPSSSARLAGLAILPDELCANADAPSRSNVKQAEMSFMVGSELAWNRLSTLAVRVGRPSLLSWKSAYPKRCFQENPGEPVCHARVQGPHQSPSTIFRPLCLSFRPAATRGRKNLLGFEPRSLRVPFPEPVRKNINRSPNGGLHKTK